MKLLEVKGLRTHFYNRRGVVKVVDGVSFDLDRGETIGLVGESGCGKSITCLSLLRIVPEPPARIVGGEVLLDGEDLLKKSPQEMRAIRGRRISMVLQDAMAGLNPVLTIGYQVKEPIETHQKLRGASLVQKVISVLRMVQIPAPEARLRDYPVQFSGGMRQRVMGGMALACEPDLLIADEPTTALDVTIQAQYLALLREIRETRRMGIIFVTHDFGIVEDMCDRVFVMYAGRVVESAPVRALFDEPAHPYTKALLDSVPRLDCKPEKLATIDGQPPPLYDLPPGCAFAPRCGNCDGKCDPSGFPPMVELGSDHRVWCWQYA